MAKIRIKIRLFWCLQDNDTHVSKCGYMNIAYTIAKEENLVNRFSLCKLLHLIDLLIIFVKNFMLRPKTKWQKCVVYAVVLFRNPKIIGTNVTESVKKR